MTKHFDDLTAQEWDLVKLYLLNYLPTMDNPYSIGRKAMEFAENVIDGINDHLRAKARNEDNIATEMVIAGNSLGPGCDLTDVVTHIEQSGPKNFAAQLKFWHSVIELMYKEKLGWGQALKKMLEGQKVSFESLDTATQFAVKKDIAKLLMGAAPFINGARFTSMINGCEVTGRPFWIAVNGQAPMEVIVSIDTLKQWEEELKPF